MAFAPHRDQLALMEVAKLDAQINKIQTQVENHPGKAQLAAADAEIAQIETQIAAIGQEIRAAEEEVQSWEQKANQSSALIAEKTQKLHSGAGMDSRMLLALQTEIDQGQENLEKQEAAALSLLEKIDAEEARLQDLQTAAKEAREKRQGIALQFQAGIEELQTEKIQIEEARAALYQPLAPDLQAAYQRSQASGGLSIIGLHSDGTSTGGIQLSPMEIAAVRAANREEIYLSEEYECIVVVLDS